MTYPEFLSEWESDKTHISVHTSGSTGIPKKITLDKGFVRASAIRTNDFFRISPECRLHSCVSPEFIGGKMMAVRASLVGCRLTWEVPSNRPLSGLGKSEEIDLLAVVPSQMSFIVENLIRMPAIRNVIVGGGVIHEELRTKIEKTGINAYETYGMTETASHIALRKVKRNGEHFIPLPGIRVDVDARECLTIRFDSGEYIVTNDLAEIYDDGSFNVTGRYDHIIVSGGKKINPYEVERKISSIIDAPFVITYEPDEKWGQRVVLIIEGERKLQLDFLIDEFRNVLQSWEIPKKIYFIDELERTPNGKIKRKR